MTPEKAQQAEFMMRTVLRKILSKPAMERLSRVKLVKPDAASQLEAYLVGLYQSGKVRDQITEEQMKMILETMNGPRDFKIVRK